MNGTDTAGGTPDLSVVIVNRNAARWLAVVLGTLGAAAAGLDCEVIVVDNGSTDDSRAVAAAAWPGLRWLAQDRNLGYVAANNVGLAAARGRHTVFLNSDIALDPQCFTRLVARMDADPQVGAASPRILNPDRSDQGCARAFPTIAAGIFGRRSPLTRAFPRNPWSRRFMTGRHHAGDAPFAVEILSSACLALPTALARELGGMDEGFRFYWVDADLCTRVRRRGRRVICVPDATLVHFEGQGGSTRTFRDRCRMVVAFHRDAYRVWWRVHGWGPLHPLRLAAALLLGARAAAVMAVQALRPGRAMTSGGRN
jgi:GT2 family glycosyltransferase